MGTKVIATIDVSRPAGRPVPLALHSRNLYCGCISWSRVVFRIQEKQVCCLDRIIFEKIVLTPFFVHDSAGRYKKAPEKS
jgi:hypothetical protein